MLIKALRNSTFYTETVSLSLNKALYLAMKWFIKGKRNFKNIFKNPRDNSLENMVYTPSIRTISRLVLLKFLPAVILDLKITLL